jgi:pyruvate kinase
MPTFVKIIASLGPASGNIATIFSMVKQGVSGFRINFSHGDPEDWTKYVDAVRSAEARFGRALALIGDLQGPSIRIGTVEQPIALKKGEAAKIVFGGGAKGGDEKVIPVPIQRFFEFVDEGDILVMDDGRTRLRISEVHPDYVEVVALTDSMITSRKAIAIYGKEIDLPPLSEKDFANIKFALEHNLDYIGLSYVRSGSDIDILRDYLRRAGREDVGIIAKIETKSAVKNLDEIMEKCDAVLVARGDLGMNFGLEEIHALQSSIVAKALENRRPVIVATQLLESMVEKPVPTRAEVVDVSTAIEMGVDALMLTGETSVGKYPLEAVSWLTKIANFVEKETIRGNLKVIAEKARGRIDSLPVMFAKGVLELAEDMNAKLVVFSIHGNTAKRISTLRPSVPVYVGSPDVNILRKLAILWGLQPLYVEAQGYEEGLPKTLQRAIELGYVSYGDLVVATYGLKEPRQRIEIQRVVH